MLDSIICAHSCELASGVERCKFVIRALNNHVANRSLRRKLEDSELDMHSRDRREMAATARSDLRSFSPTALRSNFASKARGTISSMRCLRSKARTISSSLSAASRRWANSSTPRTARTCSPATSARPTSSASRRRRISREYTGAPDPRSTSRPRKRRWRRDRYREGATPRARLRRKTSKPPCAPWRSLRPHVDAFFDKVTVNVDDKALRENRLKLLNEIRAATRAVADFSKIEGYTLTARGERSDCSNPGEGALPQSEPCGDALHPDLLRCGRRSATTVPKFANPARTGRHVPALCSCRAFPVSASHSSQPHSSTKG